MVFEVLILIQICRESAEEDAPDTTGRVSRAKADLAEPAHSTFTLPSSQPFSHAP